MLLFPLNVHLVHRGTNELSCRDIYAVDEKVTKENDL